MASESRRAESISFADFTETTLAAVARVIDARKEVQRDIPLGPVLIGLIWWPEGGPIPGQPELPPNPIKRR
jgi:hypothetical protein